MLSFPPLQRAHSPVVRSKGEGGGGRGGHPVRHPGMLFTDAARPVRQSDVRGSVQVAESDLNTKNKNMCGEESRDLEVDDSA